MHAFPRPWSVLKSTHVCWSCLLTASNQDTSWKRPLVLRVVALPYTTWPLTTRQIPSQRHISYSVLSAPKGWCDSNLNPTICNFFFSQLDKGNNFEPPCFLHPKLCLYKLISDITKIFGQVNTLQIVTFKFLAYSSISQHDVFMSQFLGIT